MAQRLLVRGGVAVVRGELAKLDIMIAGAQIAAIGAALDPGGAIVLDASGLTVGPGFIDVHVHGGGDVSFFSKDPGSVDAYARWAPRNGVTGFLVSTVGRDAGDTSALLGALARAMRPAEGAEPLGFHLEGPFLNPERKGAFPRSYLRPPSVAEFEAFQQAARGHIRQVTVAPELEGALDLIRAVADSGSVPAIGHTDATYAEANAGFAAGARHVTHLFNAMRPLHQRDGGPIAAALLQAGTCELICDGAHVAPETLRLAYSLLGPARTVIVTDNLEMAGASGHDGQFGGERLSIKGNAAVRADGTIAGSVATMDQHVRNAVRFLGIPVQDVFQLCSANPAVVAGASARKGRIEPGFDADVVLLNEALEVVATVCRGEIAFLREPGRLRR